LPLFAILCYFLLFFGEMQENPPKKDLENPQTGTIGSFKNFKYRDRGVMADLFSAADNHH
jgi:hypothetical protein